MPVRRHVTYHVIFVAGVLNAPSWRAWMGQLVKAGLELFQKAGLICNRFSTVTVKLSRKVYFLRRCHLYHTAKSLLRTIRSSVSVKLSQS